jgi:glycosyltransferase involved in cell wall biosynthesis
MRNRNDAWLVIAGGQGESGNFRAVNADQNASNVIYTNYVPGEHLPALYTGASGFVFPSLYEGFGLTVLEALACGTPVITSKTTSLLELQGGRMFMVDPRSTEEIANAITELLDDPLPRDVVSKCCESYARQFSWDKTAAQTEQVLLRYSS